MNKRQKKKQAKITAMNLFQLKSSIEKFIESIKRDPQAMRNKIINSSLPVEIKGEGILLTYYFEGKGEKA
jgi:predicted transcriptional regulator